MIEVTNTGYCKVTVNPYSGASSQQFKYIVENEADPLAVIAYIQENMLDPIPAPFGYDARPSVEDYSLERKGTGGVWELSLTFEVLANRPDDGETPPDSVPWSCDTTGGTKHINQSREVIAHHRATGIPDFTPTTTIGDDGSNVSGADVMAPSFRFEVVNTYTLDAFDMTTLLSAYRRTSHVNSTDLTIVVGAGKSITFAAGEALFAGKRANYDPQSGNVSVTSSFVGSGNTTGVSVGSISGVDIKGHELADIGTDSQPDGEGLNQKKVARVVIHRVYETSDLNGIAGLD